MEQGFLSQKVSRVGRGVKEKQVSSADNHGGTLNDVIPPIEVVAPAVSVEPVAMEMQSPVVDKSYAVDSDVESLFLYKTVLTSIVTPPKMCRNGNIVVGDRWWSLERWMAWHVLMVRGGSVEIEGNLMVTRGLKNMTSDGAVVGESVVALDGVAAMMVAWCSVGDKREGDGDEGMKMMMMTSDGGADGWRPVVMWCSVEVGSGGVRSVGGFVDGVAAMMVAWCSAGDGGESDGDEGIKIMTR
ncbi:hypothetical protein Tco_1476171 [Tanacetum coccineum]